MSDPVKTGVKGDLRQVQGAVRTREYERDGIRQRITEVRADTVGKPRVTATLNRTKNDLSPSRLGIHRPSLVPLYCPTRRCRNMSFLHPPFGTVLEPLEHAFSQTGNAIDIRCRSESTTPE